MNKHRAKKGEFAYGYTEEQLFKDEEEKKKIFELSELEKEKILYNRVTQLNIEKERKELLSKHPENDEKKNKNNNLSNESESEMGEIGKDDDYSGENKSEKKFNRSPSYSDSISDIIKSEDEEEKEKKFELTLTDIENIKVSRQFCEKYYDYNIFDENIKNAFVRINYSSKGNISSVKSGYIIGTIKEVVIDNEKPYNFNGIQCYKYFKIVHINNEKTFSLSFISNKKITENEFNEWKKRMEDNNLKLPNKDDLKIIKDNLNKIINHKISDEEINKRYDEKLETKIKNRDGNINITQQLDLLYQKYYSAKAKYNETNDKKYLNVIHKVEPEIKSLEQMRDERDKKEKKRAELDVVANINIKKIEKQIEDDKRYSKLLLQKKRQRNQFTRKNCNPKNLYEVDYDEKEDENKEKEEKKEEIHKNEKKDINNEKDNYGVKLYEQIKNIEKIIKENSNNFEKLLKDKEKNKINNNNENNNNEENNINLENFFNLAKINYNKYLNLINEQNDKNLKDPKSKIINLDEI